MTTTPMMKQYQEAKRACPDALLLFRMGDFYEMFYDDAKVAARTLIFRPDQPRQGRRRRPHGRLSLSPVGKLPGQADRRGLRAAVCDQIEDPKLAKGLVKREVTRIVTPGTVTDDALLDPRASNFLAAIVEGDPVGLAWVELSTGRFRGGEFSRRAVGRRTRPPGPRRVPAGRGRRRAPRRRTSE